MAFRSDSGSTSPYAKFMLGSRWPASFIRRSRGDTLSSQAGDERIAQGVHRT